MGTKMCPIQVIYSIVLIMARNTCYALSSSSSGPSSIQANVSLAGSGAIERAVSRKSNGVYKTFHFSVLEEGAHDFNNDKIDRAHLNYMRSPLFGPASTLDRIGTAILTTLFPAVDQMSALRRSGYVYVRSI